MYHTSANDLKLEQPKVTSSTEYSESHGSIIIRENTVYGTILKAIPLHVFSAFSLTGLELLKH
jgi:hypothetical protein